MGGGLKCARPSDLGSLVQEVFPEQQQKQNEKPKL